MDANAEPQWDFRHVPDGEFPALMQQVKCQGADLTYNTFELSLSNRKNIYLEKNGASRVLLLMLVSQTYIWLLILVAPT